MFKGLKVGFFRIVVLTISLHLGLYCDAQNVGDFRSFTSAAWKTASTWQVYNGTAWVSTSTYPGKNAGNYQVTILANHTVSINGQGISTLSMGGLTILGKLKLDGNTTGSTSNYSINSSYVEVVTGGSVELNNKANLKLPSNAVISVSEPGLAGNCNGSQHIYIGNVIYASCGITSATAFTFQQLMASGSSLKAVISSPSSVCVNDITQLTGGYVGLIDSDVTYSWSYTGPGMVSFLPDFSSQNPQIETSVPGTYTISLTVSTTRGGVTYTNTAQTYLNVIAKESYNYKTICASELPYWWDGFLFESEGVKVKQGLKNRLDCDSTATYALSLALPAVGSVVNKTICNGETVTFNGATYSTPGTYTAHLLSSTGCDSIVTLVLTACTVGSGEAYQIITSDVVTCPGVNTQLYASGVDYYKWSPATGLSDSTIANPIVNTQVSRVYTVSGYTESKTNLIHNGDFELGNTGFTSDYEYNPATLYGEGDYAVINNPNSLHGNFSACGDHTSGTGKMMVINGNTVAKSKVWGQTIQVDPNKEYAFYAYVTPVNASNPPVLQFSINGQILGEPYQSPSTTCQWNKFYAIWKSGTAQVAEISIVNQNIVANGNDFALDDIKYVELYKSSALVHVNVGANSSTTQRSVCKKDLPYLWNGKLFTNSGIYKDTLINAVGCDSIATLELTVKAESYSNTKVDICSKDAPYLWNGKSYLSTGIYKDTLVNAAGCDSIATLELTVKAESYSTTAIAICSKEAPYVWNGKSYLSTGIYKDTLTNAVGCDSIATLELTVKAESYSTTVISICSKEAPYLWHGKSYSSTGIYKETLVNAAGCDSIATLDLTVKAESFSTTTIAICSKDAPYLWNGKSYLSTGIYKDTLTNAVGCDSIATLELTVKAESYSTTKVDICSKDAPYIWHGKSYSLSGIYKDTLINAVGCDSIATLELTVKAESYSTSTIAICSKEAPYIWNGKSYSSTGIYKDTLTNAVGCDSIATLELTVKAESYSTSTIAICSKEALYVWNGKSYLSTGIYKDTLTNAVGCDSIATLELTVKAESYSTTKVDICSKEAPYIWNGKSYLSTGIYKDTLTNAVGCDSIATLELTVKAESYSITKVDICSKEAPYLWNGKSYSSTGIYKDTLINAVGCDSIATLELTVKAESYSTSTIAICSKEAPYLWHGKSYSLTGIYKDTLTNAAGCDSIATLELTVKAESYSTTAIAICSKEAPYIWHGKSYLSTGIYKDTLVNAAGCDSVATLELTVKAESYSTSTIAICSKEAPYIWHGKFYSSTGIYKDTLINAVGCDSIATLELTVKAESYSTTAIAICSKEAPYIWNGKFYSSTGIYKDTLTNAVGCDSIATLELTVKEESYSTTKVDICSKEAPYIWNGKSYSLTGIYKDTLVNAAGCDSIATLELTVKAESYSTTTISICSKEAPHLWHGKFYSSTGIYKDTLTNAVGCDSIATLELTVKEESYSTTKVDICSKEAPYLWNGKSYLSTGIYKDTLINAVGCDSIATLELTVKEESYSTTKVDICSKEAPYIWHGKSYLSTGIYKDTLINAVGCDSIATLELTVKAESYSTSTIAICSKEAPYIWNGKSYSLTGIYKDTLTNTVGCDSIATLELTVKAESYSTSTIAICSKEAPYLWHGKSYSSTGIYKDTLINAVDCDSIATLELTVKTESYSTTKVDICSKEAPYLWHGKSYSLSGIYKDTLTNAAGCDSIATLELTVKAESYSTTKVDICSKDAPYLWNGKSYLSTGIYKDTLTNAVGCDSIATLELTVKAESYSTTKVDICSKDAPYLWNGKSYSYTGIYKDTLVNAVGCDSIATLELTVKAESYSTTIVDICPKDAPYLWNGKSYLTTGIYKDTLTNAVGCDSIATLELTVKAESYSNTKVDICSKDAPYLWNGKSYSSTGIYKDTLINAVDCDSIATLELTVKTESYSTTKVDICSKEAPYIWNGKSYSFTGIYKDTLTNTVGCDSIATLELTVKAESFSTTAIAICSKEAPYIWNGKFYSSTGIYKDTLINAVGCDSIATLELTVKAESYSTSTIAICSKDAPYLWNRKSYSLTGIYKDTLTNAVGCDSIATLELTVKAESYSTTKVDICSKDAPYLWHGKSYSLTGIYKDTLINAVGCDSIATLELTVKAESYSTSTIAICSKEAPYLWNGKSYSLTGIYKDTLVNVAGCDSIATLELTVKAESYSNTKVDICSKDAPYLWNGKSYSSTGIYKDTLTNAVGCDSIATLELTVKAESYSNTKVDICSKDAPYLWNGKSYSSTGIYKDTLINAVDCDSIATLELTVKTESYSTTKVDICSKEAPYLWNGKSYSSTGIYKDTLTNAVGCDSIATLELTVKEESYSTTKVDICSKEAPYIWNGKSYSFTGIYKDTLINAVGCDSIATLELTVKAESYSTSTIAICSKEAPYLWHGKSYLSTGIYKDTLVNAAGCDSIATLELTVKAESYSTTEVDICSKDAPYIWHGKSYSLSGIYKDTLINAVGCDSIATLELTVKAESYSTTKVDICSKEAPYIWNGKSYSSTGIYKDTLINAVGCDSIATLELTVKEESYSTTKVDICSKEAPYLWNGKSYLFTGIYKDTLVNAVGCDSIATLELTVKTESYSTTKVDICSKEAPYLWHGKSYSSTGIYKDTLVNVAGCDSIATLELTVKAESYSITKVDICSKEAPYLWRGKSYSLTGIYKDTLTNAVGCDSIATLELTVKAENYSTSTIAICSKEAPYLWNGKSYSSTGIYKDTLINAVGCDSIATLELTVKAESYSTTAIAICSKEAPYLWHGKSYSSTGIYKDTLINAVGCDSIATLELTVNKESIVPVREVTICEGDSVSFFGKYYKQSGTYQSYFTNKYGCDSIVSLKLTVNKVAHTYLMRVICPLQLPYKWNGINCLGAGSYMYRATSANGCDSIVQLNLRVEDPIRSSTTVTLCRSDLPFSWNGISCQEAGSYTVRLKTPAGCDSVAMLKLQVLPVNTEVKAVNLCEGESYVYDGTLYNSPGSYEVHLQSATGCDSVMVLVLRYSKGSTTSQVVYLVPNETYSANGKTYSDEGVYTEVFKSANNCDSLVITEILHLKIPNTMTPNGDGINDCFMRGYKVQIYNRNGILFFEGNNGWDGTRNGVPVVPGTYFYVLYYQSGTELKSKQGYITVVR